MKWDIDFTLSINYTDDTIRAIAKTPPQQKIKDEFLSQRVRMLPFELLLQLTPPTVGLRIGFELVNSKSVFESFFLELRIGPTEIYGRKE